MDDSPSNYVLKTYLLPNARAHPQVDGVFLNTFDWFEPETIAVLDGGRFVYLNFGTREPISSEQVSEIGKGLEICGFKLLWVLKEEILELFGNTVLEMEKKGKIVKAGEYDEAVMKHPAIGLFVNQCE
ncbi:hypothetical protein RND71_011369 [Anisodus tanguticus]|uniref:Uncharacterized protein n=1 Tax=Anisodus tanguticus TaxID=243964 RepID=A0AAE1SDL7_9SOLA|nr:hypothetical protein RND71_011369 [Anisodus tanguticus]